MQVNLRHNWMKLFKKDVEEEEDDDISDLMTHFYGGGGEGSSFNNENKGKNKPKEIFISTKNPNRYRNRYYIKSHKQKQKYNYKEIHHPKYNNTNNISYIDSLELIKAPSNINHQSISTTNSKNESPNNNISKPVKPETINNSPPATPPNQPIKPEKKISPPPTPPIIPQYQPYKPDTKINLPPIITPVQPILKKGSGNHVEKTEKTEAILDTVPATPGSKSHLSPTERLELAKKARLMQIVQYKDEEKTIKSDFKKRYFVLFMFYYKKDFWLKL